jgi:cytochrome P450
LRDATGYRSGHGVAANRTANALGRDTTLNSDDDAHARRRRVLMRSLGAKVIGDLEASLRREAERLIGDLLRRPHFETARDLCSRLPMSVVSGLVGVRGGQQMLRWDLWITSAGEPPRPAVQSAGIRTGSIQPAP